MRLIPNKVEEYFQKPGIDGIYEAIRDAAVVCYQTDTEKMKLSPREFVEQVLLKNGHSRPLEFGTVYMKIPSTAAVPMEWYHSRQFYRWEKYTDSIWTHRIFDSETGCWCITTNMRVIMQGSYGTDLEAWRNGYARNWLADVFEFGCEPTELHEKRRTFTMLASRGATDDFRTHITLSSVCESTRFCNYSKGKFGSELTFIDPVWWKDKTETYNSIIKEFEIDETKYTALSTYCPEAQQLKRILPLGVKAELRLCGYDDAWQNLFWRRCDGHADPECQLVAEKIKHIYLTPSQGANPSAEV